MLLYLAAKGTRLYVDGGNDVFPWLQDQRGIDCSVVSSTLHTQGAHLSPVPSYRRVPVPVFVLPGYYQ